MYKTLNNAESSEQIVAASYSALYIIFINTQLFDNRKNPVVDYPTIND